MILKHLNKYIKQWKMWLQDTTEDR